MKPALLLALLLTQLHTSAQQPRPADFKAEIISGSITLGAGLATAIAARYTSTGTQYRESTLFWAGITAIATGSIVISIGADDLQAHKRATARKSTASLSISPASLRLTF